MLQTKEVKVKLGPSNIKYYENKNYEIPRTSISKGRECVKRGTELKVEVEDLPDGSFESVCIECDGCGKILSTVRWCNYLRYVKDDGKYYCSNCAKSGFKEPTSFEEWCFNNLPKNEADKLLLRWDNDLNIDKLGVVLTPKNVSYRSMGIDSKGFWFKCLDHPEHGSEQKRISGFTGNHGSITCNQCNTIAVTHPHLIKYFINKDDSLKYSIFTKVVIPMRCPECGFEKDTPTTNLNRSGFVCAQCSDGVSYPEKFLSSFLKQVNIIFKHQLSKVIFKWCDKYKYDFYITKLDIIIETHGIQHYEECTGWGNKNSLSDIQEIDTKKELLANKNGKKYIPIDCRYSELEWIKNSIMDSELPIIFNFVKDDIDWLKCHEYSCKSLVKAVCDLWNSGINNVTKIAEKIDLERTTIVKYLKQGVNLGWCNYDSKIEEKKRIIATRERFSKKVICLNTNEVFESQKEASEKYNMKSSRGISACCSKNDTHTSCGKHPVTGEKLIWMDYNEFLKLN